MNELPLVGKFIYTQLAADADTAAIVGTRIYDEVAAEGSGEALKIVYQHMAGEDSKGLGTVRLLVNPIYQIKVIVRGGLNDNARTVADRIDELFQNTVNEVMDDYVFSSRRTRPIKYTEPNPAGIFTHLGGLYRFHLHPVA